LKTITKDSGLLVLKDLMIIGEKLYDFFPPKNKIGVGKRSESVPELLKISFLSDR